MDEDKLTEDAEFQFSSDFGTPDSSVLAEGFNSYGVRENRNEEGELESVDVMYRAMEPGPPDERKGVRITEDFLRNVASKEYNNPPFMLDHQKNTLDKLGRVREVTYQNGALYVMNRVPNTGSSVKDDAIADFTHEPPAIEDGSVGFGDTYEIERNAAGEPEMVDGRLNEFSSTPFPGGYEDGGVQATASFSDAVEEEFGDFDDEPDGSEDTRSALTFKKETFDNMEFSTVETTDPVDEMGEEELRGVVEQYEEVNEDNKAAFSEVKEALEAEPELPDEVADYKQELVEDVDEVSPLGEDELEGFSITRLDELRSEFSGEETETEDAEDGEDSEGEFSDMGKQGETSDPEEANFSDGEEIVADVPGLK